MKIKNNENKFSKKRKTKKRFFTTKKNSGKFFELYGESSTVIFSFLKNNSYIWRLTANVVYVDQ
jgi:hypothetical protein